MGSNRLQRTTRFWNALGCVQIESSTFMRRCTFHKQRICSLNDNLARTGTMPISCSLFPCWCDGEIKAFLLLCLSRPPDDHQAHGSDLKKTITLFIVLLKITLWLLSGLAGNTFRSVPPPISPAPAHPFRGLSWWAWGRWWRTPYIPRKTSASLFYPTGF